MDEAGARASLARLRDSPKPRVLLVSHAEAGGLARHVNDLARCIERDVEPLVIQPHAGSLVALRWLRSGESLALYLDAAKEWPNLLEMLAGIGIDRVHLHHVHGWPPDILDLPARLDCPYDVTIHDYFAACPNYHMLDGHARYCAAEPGCQKCVDRAPAQWPISIDAWRERFARFLGGASRVIAPSEDAARRIRIFFPPLSPVVWPHPEPEPAAAGRAVRVLVPGAMSLAKGLEVLEACVADSARRNLGLFFRVLGFVARPMATWPQAPLSISGEFADGTLDALIAAEGGDVCFFPAQCPEVFSYTLSAALDSGLPVVAAGIGALPERVAASPRGHVVPWNASAGEMNDALLAAVPQRAAPAPGRPRMSFDEYHRRYVEPIATSVGRARREPAWEARWLTPPPSEPDRRPLAFFFEDGIVCGHASSVEGLRRYAFDPDSLHAATDSRVRELIEALERERAKVQPVDAPATPPAGTLRNLARRLRGGKP